MTTTATDCLSLSAVQINELIESQRRFFDSGITRSFAFRKAQLQVLKQAVKRHERRFIEALHQDLRKDEFEAYGTELGPFYKEIDHAILHLKAWMEPTRVATPIMFFPSTSYTVREPLGVTLHISPWNYPFVLLFSGMIAAIAGGNTMILKPSELSPATTAVVEALISETYETDFIAIITGPGHLVTSEMIEQYHFDHILYTGSTAVGKLIMQAAARHLSPVTLELGGKCPAIVTESAALNYAARKIAWGKLMNAGQTCVTNDYVLVHASVKDKLVALLKTAFESMTGTNPQESPHYGRIINDRQFKRIAGYMDDGAIVYGGQTDAANRFIAPTILEGVKAEAKVMQEEIFGPVLPVITYQSNEEALEIIHRNAYPLSLYVYASKKATANFFLERVRFGGGCVNNGIIHLGNPNLGFGGVGSSGMGSYHGKDGFDTFTHKKSIVKSPSWFDLPLWYTPRKPWYTAVVRKLMG